ncbi:hypothetical protein Tco_0442571 [Tanacetum coccineum]
MCGDLLLLLIDTMADVIINALAEQAPAMAPPTRTDEHILPRSRWVPVGATSHHEQWFDLTKETLRDALQITPVDNNNAFSSPPTPDVLIKFVNNLGYPKVGLKDRDPVLQILWGVVKRAHIDYAERMWERISTQYNTYFQKDKKNMAQHTQERQEMPPSFFAPTKPSGHDESSSLYVELGLTDSETDSNEEVPGVDAGHQDEGQAGPNPGIQEEGQAGSNPGDDVVSQPQPSHVVHAGPNLEHMDVEENLKLPTEDQVRLEEPASSAGTLSSLQNLDKEFSFTNQFLEEKSQEDEPKKTNTKLEVQSMVTIPIHQDTSSVLLMTSPVIDLTVSQPVSITVQAPLPTSTAIVTRIGELEQHMADLLQDNLALEKRLDKHGSRLYKLENLDIPHQVSKAVDEIVTDAVDWAIQAPLRDRFIDLPEADVKEILHHRLWETKSYEAHEDHKKLYEAWRSQLDRDHLIQFLLIWLVEKQEIRRKRRHRSKGTAAPSFSKITTSAEYTAWTTTNTRLKPYFLSIPEDLHMDADLDPDEQVHSYDVEDIGECSHSYKLGIIWGSDESCGFSMRSTSFSDGTLQQIDEALDHRVKEFKVNRMNPGLNTRFWTRKDVEKDSMGSCFDIQKRLKTRRIFRNLESFVGGQIRKGDYRLLQRTE